MKRVAIAVALVSAPLTTTSALSASCVYGPAGYSHAPDFSSFTQFFDDFAAMVGDPATCAPLSVDLTDGGANPIPAGTIIAYSADYRGFLEPDSTATITVANGGNTDSATITASDGIPVDGLVLSNIVGTSTGSLDSDISLAMQTYSDPANYFFLDSVDYLELARTTTGDVQVSIDALSASETGLVTQLRSTGDLLTGAGHRLDAPDGFSALGGLGSGILGATGHYTFADGLSVLGGIAAFSQQSNGASASGVLASGALRYLAPSPDMFRPYAEIGINSAPLMSMSFTRTYATSIGDITGTSAGSGAMFGGYVRGGALFAPDPNNEIVFSATLAHDWLNTDGLSETLSTSNPFALASQSQTLGFDTAKIGVDWTASLSPQLELTLSGAVGRTVAHDPVSADVTFAGTIQAAARSENFAEYGARLAYQLDDFQTVGGFVHGTTGELSGTHMLVGGDYHVRF